MYAKVHSLGLSARALSCLWLALFYFARHELGGKPKESTAQYGVGLTFFLARLRIVNSRRKNLTQSTVYFAFGHRKRGQILLLILSLQGVINALLNGQLVLVRLVLFVSCFVFLRLEQVG